MSGIIHMPLWPSAGWLFCLIWEHTGLVLSNTLLNCLWTNQKKVWKSKKKKKRRGFYLWVNVSDHKCYCTSLSIYATLSFNSTTFWFKYLNTVKSHLFKTFSYFAVYMWHCSFISIYNGQISLALVWKRIRATLERNFCRIWEFILT